MRQKSHPGASRLVRVFLRAGVEEDPGALELIRTLRAVRRRGYVTLGELKRVCRWKAVRAIRHIEKNSGWRVRSVSQRALAASDERLRLETLCSLDGVSVPMASALLMAIHPERYGVIDIRAWQRLYKLGAVTSNRRGAGFTAGQWLEYLEVLRGVASALGTTPRLVDFALYRSSTLTQKAPIYGPSRFTPPASHCR